MNNRRVALGPGARALVLLLAGGILVLPCRTSSHTLEAPAFVQSDSGGHLYFEAVFTVGPGDAVFGYWTIDGSDNTDFGIMHADGFCLGTLEEGTVDVLPVAANLVDLDQTGTVIIEYYICYDQAYFTQTTILTPIVAGLFDPSEVGEQTTWGAIKATYR